MGLYTGEPGRDPTKEAPLAYAEVQALVERMRRKDATPESAEWVLWKIKPLCDEFFDHEGLLAWSREASGKLAGAYRDAGLPGSPEGAVGLFEARRNLEEALKAPSPLSVAKAELAFNHVLHHAPECGGALEGLKRLEAVRQAPASPRQDRTEVPVEAKLAAITQVCQWPEKTPQGVCTGCRWPDRVTVDGKAAVEGCSYRKTLVTPLQQAAGRRFHAPESSQVQAAYENAGPELKARLDPVISRLYEFL